MPPTTAAPSPDNGDDYGDEFGDFEIVTEKPIYVSSVPTLAEESCATVIPVLGAGTTCVNLKVTMMMMVLK